MREQQRPQTLTEEEREQLRALGSDLGRVWSAATTTDRDRQQLLRTLIEEVTVDVVREARRATLARGAITELILSAPPATSRRSGPTYGQFSSYHLKLRRGLGAARIRPRTIEYAT